MPHRLLTFLLTLATAAGASHGASLESVRYTIRLPEAKAHYVEVEAVVPTDGLERIEVFMPVWTPGSYLVREYARQVDQVTAAADDGTVLPAEKTTKNRWTIANGKHARVHLRYRLYGREVNIRGAWVEPDFAFLNGGAVFLTPADRFQRPYEVKVELPAGWHGVYTALDATADPTRFTAPDYDTLVDSPILAGSPQVNSFELDGARHFLVTVGGAGVWDNVRAAQALAKIAQTQRDFWGFLPSREPFYVFNLLNGGRSGIEHRQSFVLSADRWLSRTPSGINSWLSLVSHEYFHFWNGKRLRPVELGPFQYEHEVYTKSLWIVEGVTSYYQHLMLRRAGIVSRTDLLTTFSGAIQSAQNSPGRHIQSLADASFDTWIKAYRPDENTPNTTVNYYTYGSVAALLLDAEIRRASHGAKSLDDLMRLAYARYSGAHGYTEAEFAALASEVAGTDLSGWLNRTVKGTGDFDYQPALDWFGLAFDTAAEKPAEANGADPASPPRAWLGAETKIDSGRLVVTQVRTGTPAYDAGLSPDDEILAIDDYRVRADHLATRLGSYRPGEKITLLVARLDYLLRLETTLGADPVNRWKLVIRKDATPEQTARLKAWLGDDSAAVPQIAGV
jgi:predicted metalloprotease with PDZ domain